MTPERSLSSRLFAHGGIYAAARVAEHSLGLILVPVYARELQTRGYGVVSLLGTVTPFVAILFGQGLLSAWFRLRHDYEPGPERRRFESTIVWYLVGSGLVLLVLLSASGRWIAHLLADDVAFFPLIWMALLTGALQVYSDLQLRRAYSDQQPMAVVAFSLPKTLCTRVAILACVTIFQLGPLGKVGAETAVTFLFALWAFRLIRPAGPRSASWPILRRSLGYGLPVIPHMLATQVSAVASRILLSRTLGLSATGIYAMGAAIADVANMISMSLNQGFSPLFIGEMKRLERGDLSPDERMHAQRSLVRAGLLMVAATTWVALALTACAREVLVVLATDSFRQSYIVVAPLAGAAVLRSSYFVFSQPLFYSSQAIRRMPRISIVSAIVNIGLNLLLLPTIGFIGAAFSLLASSFVMAVHAFLAGRRVLHQPYVATNWWLLYGTTAVGLCALPTLDATLPSFPIRVAAKTVTTGLLLLASLLIVGSNPRDALRFLRNASRGEA